jgi:2-polyprenyl-6-methoxyphenol hydroxylase-like FAD-dependent oxidoreductase
MKPNPRSNDPIVIVGGGPVGLLLASRLGQRGIPCILVEKRLEPPGWSHAIGVTPASLAILKRGGLDAAFISRGVTVERARVFDDWGEVGVLDFHGLPSEFPFILSIPQSETISLLTENLHRLPLVTFCTGLELQALTVEADRVRLSLAVAGGRQAVELAARWVIGCDGHNSTIRSLAGFPFQRRSYSPSFVMGEYEDKTGWGREARLFFTRFGSLESFPLPDRMRRWVVLLPPGCEEPGVPKLLESRTRLICGQSLEGLGRAQEMTFVPERLLASSFFRGRVILAGDAAHVMSPIGGHGMNMGLGDAEHLAGLFPDLDEPGRAGPLLELYDKRRRAAFETASVRAAAGMWLGTRTGRHASSVRARLFKWALHSRPMAGRLSRHYAMLPTPSEMAPAG